MNPTSLSSGHLSRFVPRAPLGRVIVAISLLGCAVVLLPNRAEAQINRAVDTGALAPGRIEGALVVGKKAVRGVVVTVRETGQTAETDKSGGYVFPSIAPGTYTLVATADGYQKMHITDVVVKPNSLITLSQIEMHKPIEGVMTLEPYVVKGETKALELEKYLVEGRKDDPFEGANVDIPRTVNDAQPYYIFDAKTIENSGALNTEDFLKQRLTMNTVAITSSQATATGGLSRGNTSTLNLRGIGADKTLVLINGRRIAGPVVAGGGFASYSQPDLNGYPLSAIDRIEILPSSASGIYGASAMGGVINVVLKRDYSGGEIRATYDNTMDTDAARRTVGLTYGASLFGGKTQIMITGQWSDSQPFYLQDRQELFQRGVDEIQKNSPAFFQSAGIPFLGATPNIVSATYFTFVPAFSYIPDPGVLTLKNGTSLNSKITYINPGTAPTSNPSSLYSSLLANAGKWNMASPASSQGPTGLTRPLGFLPEVKSVAVSLGQDIGSRVKVTLDWNHMENDASSAYGGDPTGSSVTIAPDNPYNPFTGPVTVSLPAVQSFPVTAFSTTDAATLGATVKLPHDWIMQGDLTWSRNKMLNSYALLDQSAFSTYFSTIGLTFNPFYDTLANGLDLSEYTSRTTYVTESSISSAALRASGPLMTLSWGTPTLTVGLERRRAEQEPSTQTVIWNKSPANSSQALLYGRAQTTDSLYAEALIPLVKSDRYRGLKSLQLQISGRVEGTEVDTGTPSQTTYLQSGAVVYPEPTQNGLPFRTTQKYDSTNGTVGLKYQPVSDITIRASFATAYLPPDPTQLVKNTVPDPNLFQYVTDPKNGGALAFPLLYSGGNPNLKPQSSESYNGGIIWAPSKSVLKGLRLNAEYYKIVQHDPISTLSQQQVVDNEDIFPGRVTRDAFNQITAVDISVMNLYRLETEGWDLSADYTLPTNIGTFNFHAVESIVLHLKQKLLVDEPETDSVNFPSEGGAAKYKTNATLTWERKGWIAGWTVRYFSGYKQYGSAGGPNSVINNGLAPDPRYILAQGGEDVDSQTYHDAFVGYTFRKRPGVSSLGRSLLADLTLQAGVKNVFDTQPPFDAFYDFYISPYGDTRLRSYWITVKKAF